MGIDGLLSVRDVIDIEARLLAVHDTLQRAGHMQLVPHGKHGSAVGIIYCTKVTQVQIYQHLGSASRTERRDEEE